MQVGDQWKDQWTGESGCLGWVLVGLAGGEYVLIWYAILFEGPTNTHETLLEVDAHETTVATQSPAFGSIYAYERSQKCWRA